MRKLSQVIVQSGVWIYREIIAVALLSVVSSLVLLPFVFFLPVGVALVFIALVYVPLCTGALDACHRMLKGERGLLGAMFRGAVRHYGASVVFALVCALFVVILASSWWYYGNRSGTFYFALAVFQTYFVAMFFVSQTYTLPLVVQERIGIFAAMGKSVKLFASHPGYTFGAFLQIVCLALLLGLTVVGFAGLFVGMVGIYANLITANLLTKKEEASEPESGRANADGFRTA